MIVKHIFITLSRIDVKSISMPTVVECLKKLIDNKIQVFIVQETHQDGHLHYHILLILRKGLSKHTYKKTVIELFPDFKGWGIDVAGVRSLSFTCKYILKCIGDIKDLFIHGSSKEDFFKLGGLKEILIYTSITNFNGTLEEWKSSRLINRESYYKNFKKVNLIWNDIQKDSIKSLKNIQQVIDDKYKFDETFPIPAEGVLLLLKTCQLLFTDHQWKQTNLLLLGSPNCGKTTFFKKLETATGGKLFWCSTRAGDIRNFDPKNIAIILDDIFTKDSHWALPLLLKIVGREGFTGDQKITNLVQVPKGVPVFIVRNYVRLFKNSDAIIARLIRLYIVQPINWLGFTDEQFLKLLDLGIDIVKDLREDNPDLFHELCYLTDVTNMSLYLGDWLQYCFDRINPTKWEVYYKQTFMKDWVFRETCKPTVHKYFYNNIYRNYLNPKEN